MSMRRSSAPTIRRLVVIFAAFLLCSIGFAAPAQAVNECGSTEAGFLASSCHNTSIIATSSLLTKEDILANISLYEEWGFTREWVEAQEVTILTVRPDVNWVACSNNGPDGLCRRAEGDTFISGPMTYTFEAGTTFHVLGTPDKWIALMCGNFKLPDVPPTESDARKVSFDVVDWPSRINADTNVTVTVRVVLEATGNRATNDVTDFIRVTGPADCTISTVAPIEATLVNGVPQTFERSVTLNCANPSDHEFTFTDDLIGQAGVLDRNLDNNHQSFSRSTEVFDDSDLAVAGTTLVCDDSTKVGTSFTCTGATTAHNAGPYGPTTADVTLALTGLSDCTITPLQGDDLIGVALPLQGDMG